MSRRFFSGRTQQAAVLAAASHFGIEPDEVAYEEIDKRHGRLKSRGKVVIAVDPEEPRRPVPPTPDDRRRPAGEEPSKAEAETERKGAGRKEAEPEEAEPEEAEPEEAEVEASEAVAEDAREVEEAEKPEPPPRRRARSAGEDGRRERPAAREGSKRRGRRSGEGASPAGEGDGGLVELRDRPRALGDRYRPAEGPLAEAAESAMGVIAGVAGLELEATVLDGDERLEIDVSGAHELLTAEDGELLIAIEHLLPRVMRGFGDETAAVRVDSENFQEIREERLRSYAQQVANEVRKSGRTQTVDPLSPSDRRIVHLTVSDEPGVESDSQGSGYLKRVKISPA